MYNSVIGVRKSESRARNARYSEPVVCRVYNKSKNQRVQQILPILDWTDEDELEFIQEYDIRLHPLYYCEDGTIDITRRLGCMCCPLKSPRKRMEDFKAHPKMLRQYIRNAKIYLETHPNSSVHGWACSVYEWMFAEIMCPKHSDFVATYHNSLINYDSDYYKQRLQALFDVDLDI